MRSYITIFCLLILTSCAETSNKEVFDSMEFMVGSWMNEELNEVTETWERVNEYHYRGVVLNQTGNDIKKLEDLSIIAKGDSIFFIAKFPEVSNPTFFLYDKEAEGISFVNELNDYPQRITYYLRDDLNLSARLEGNLDGEEKTINFNFVPKQ